MTTSWKGIMTRYERYEYAVLFKADAIADGWDCEPTYPKSESEDQAVTLKREGFVMMIVSRYNPDNTPGFEYYTSIHIWGPDGLAIEPPLHYNWEKIKAGLRTCNSCGATDVDTARYSFAGRACNGCLPELKRKHEYPGWCN